MATVKSSWADEMDDYDDSPRFSSGMQLNRQLGWGLGDKFRVNFWDNFRTGDLIEVETNMI